jgi:cytochrome P450
MPQILLDVTRAYGPVSRLRMGPAELYVVGDGDLIVEMISRRAGELRKSNRTRQVLDGHLGNGLVTLEGAEHRRHRRLVQPAMHTASIAAQSRTMVELARRRVESWPDGSTQDILREMQDLTLRIIAAALFRVDDEEMVAAVREFAASLNVVLRRPFPIPGWLPTVGNWRRRVSVRRVDALAYDLIRQRASAGPPAASAGEHASAGPGEGPEAGGDLLGLLIDATDADGGPQLSDVEVRDELLTMFFAGHETSAAALTWALYLLAEHPDVAETVRSELAGGTRDLLDGVVKETLRLYPPAWVFDRSPLHDLSIGGYAVPRDANVLFSPWVAHRDPSRWPAADQFRPQRWTADWVPSRGAYLPFGDGPRMCVGNRFAEAEIQLVLATILPRVRLSLVDSSGVRPDGDATLRPRGGLTMRVERLD